MKSRVPTVQEIARKAAEEAVAKRTQALEAKYKSIEQQAVNHTIAFCMRVLETKYGFREKRLTDFLRHLGDTVKSSLDDQDMGSHDIIQHMLDSYGIDILGSKHTGSDI